MCKQIDMEYSLHQMRSDSILIEELSESCDLTALEAEDYLFDLLRTRAAIDKAIESLKGKIH